MSRRPSSNRPSRSRRNSQRDGDDDRYNDDNNEAPSGSANPNDRDDTDDEMIPGPSEPPRPNPYERRDRSNQVLCYRQNRPTFVNGRIEVQPVRMPPASRVGDRYNTPHPYDYRPNAPRPRNPRPAFRPQLNPRPAFQTQLGDERRAEPNPSQRSRRPSERNGEPSPAKRSRRENRDDEPGPSNPPNRSQNRRGVVRRDEPGPSNRPRSRSQRDNGRSVQPDPSNRPRSRSERYDEPDEPGPSSRLMRPRERFDAPGPSNRSQRENGRIEQPGPSNRSQSDNPYDQPGPSSRIRRSVDPGAQSSPAKRSRHENARDENSGASNGSRRENRNDEPGPSRAGPPPYNGPERAPIVEHPYHPPLVNSSSYDYDGTEFTSYAQTYPQFRPPSQHSRPASSVAARSTDSISPQPSVTAPSINEESADEERPPVNPESQLTAGNLATLEEQQRNPDRVLFERRPTAPQRGRGRSSRQSARMLPNCRTVAVEDVLRKYARAARLRNPGRAVIRRRCTKSVPSNKKIRLNRKPKDPKNQENPISSAIQRLLDAYEAKNAGKLGRFSYCNGNTCNGNAEPQGCAAAARDERYVGEDPNNYEWPEEPEQPEDESESSDDEADGRRRQ